MKTGAGIADEPVREGLHGIRIKQSQRNFVPIVTSGIRRLVTLNSPRRWIATEP